MRLPSRKSATTWKVTLLLEFPDPLVRRTALERWIGVEDRCWVRVGESDRVFVIADGDIAPSTVQAMKSGARWSIAWITANIVTR